MTSTCILNSATKCKPRYRSRACPPTVAPPRKRNGTAAEPTPSPSTKVHNTNSPAEETKDDGVWQTPDRKPRKRKDAKLRTGKKKKTGIVLNPSEMARKATPYRSDMKAKGVLAVRALEGFIIDMPWSNAVDSNGEVTRLGKKDLALYVAVESIAEGCELETSANLASRLFDVPADTVKKAWYAFQKSDYTFTASLRGKHPKLQWALEEHDLKVRLIACARVYVFRIE
jgi:hypothetical protein